MVKGWSFLHLWYIRDILNLIRDDIQSAIDRRATEAWTELPTDFNIPTMTPTDAQRIIYYYVARTLEDKSYTIAFRRKGANTHNQKWYIRTRWFTEDDIKARKAMDKYISSRTEYEHPIGDEDIVTHRRRARKGEKKSRVVTSGIEKAKMRARANQRAAEYTYGGAGSENPIYGNYDGEETDSMQEYTIFN